MTVVCYLWMDYFELCSWCSVFILKRMFGTMLCGVTCSVVFAMSDMPTQVLLGLLIISFDSLRSEFSIVTVDSFFSNAYKLHVWHAIEWIRVPFDFLASRTYTTDSNSFCN